MIIPLFLGLGAVLLIGYCLIAAVYLPYSVYKDIQISKCPVRLDHSRYIGRICSEDNKIIKLILDNTEYSVPFEEYERVGCRCEGMKIGYLVHQDVKYYGYIYEDEYISKIDQVLKLTWDNQYTVINPESNPAVISEIGAFIGEFFLSRKDNKATCNFVFYNGKECLVLEKIEELEGPYYLVPSEFKFNQNTGSFVKITYKGNKLISCELLDEYETSLKQGTTGDKNNYNNILGGDLW